MKALLISPAHHPGVASLAQAEPLPNVPILGRSLAEHWIVHRASLGAKEIWISAFDRPDQVRQTVGTGAKWGVNIEVIPERIELTAEQARAKYQTTATGGWLNQPNDVAVMDYLPALPERNLFDSHAGLFSALMAQLPNAATPDRIGITQVQPGVWIGLRTRLGRRVELRAPCWLGENVYVGPGSVVGPNAILEDRVFVEGSASISESVVGPETFVGALTELHHSIAWGNALIDWNAGSCLQVPDPFVLSSLAAPRRRSKRTSRASRMMAWLILALTLPCGLAAAFRSKMMGQPMFRRRQAEPPQSGQGTNAEKPVTYYELESSTGWLRRWPQLWNVARGEFAWIGNRPLSPREADRLANEFERLWLSAPIGLISLADAMGCGEAFDDDARAHASFYAVQASRRLDVSILCRALLASYRRPWLAPEKEPVTSLVPTSFAKAEK